MWSPDVHGQKEIFFSRDFGGIENRFRFQCVIYMYSSALHDHVMGALDLQVESVKGLSRFKSQRQTDRQTKIARAWQKVDKEK